MFYFDVAIKSILEKLNMLSGKNSETLEQFLTTLEKIESEEKKQQFPICKFLRGKATIIHNLLITVDESLALFQEACRGQYNNLSCALWNENSKLRMYAVGKKVIDTDKLQKTLSFKETFNTAKTIINSNSDTLIATYIHSVNDPDLLQKTYQHLQERTDKNALQYLVELRQNQLTHTTKRRESESASFFKPQQNAKRDYQQSRYTRNRPPKHLGQIITEMNKQNNLVTTPKTNLNLKASNYKPTKAQFYYGAKLIDIPFVFSLGVEPNALKPLNDEQKNFEGETTLTNEDVLIPFTAEPLNAAQKDLEGKMKIIISKPLNTEQNNLKQQITFIPEAVIHDGLKRKRDTNDEPLNTNARQRI